MNFLNKNYQKTQPDVFFNQRKDNINEDERFFVVPLIKNQNSNNNFQKIANEDNRKNLHHQQMK